MIAIDDVASIRRIVIFRPGAIGDTLLTFPSLLGLRRRFPEAAVTVVGNRAALSLGQAAGLVDESEAFGADWVSDLFGDEPTADLRARLERFDLGIVWMHAPAAARDLAVRVEMAGVKRVLPAVSFPPPGSGCHVADHLFATLAPLGIGGRRPELTLTLTLSQREREQAGSVRGNGGLEQPFVVFHPGAGGRRKRWPAERFAALAERLAGLGCDVAITQGESDEEAVAAMRASLRQVQPRVLAGLRLAELAVVLARARLFIGNDSGITHLASLLGVPTVGIFGPYDPAYWAPIGPRVAIVDGGRSCPHRADPREGCRVCDLLTGIDLSLVWDAALGLLRSPGSSSQPAACPFPRGMV
jgi:heptosyltransferase III